MIDELMQRLGMTSSGKMADEALSSVDWNALHERSQSTFDRVRNGGSLALESGMQQAPPVSAMDRYKQWTPPQQVRGPIQAIKDAFTPRQDEQGNPKADSLGSILNAALMSMGRTPGSARVSNPVSELPSRQLHEPERIVGASVVLGGKVFVAPNHALALMKAEKLGIDPAPAYERANMNDWWPGDANTEGGFVTSHGRIVSRHEAVDVLEKAGNLKFDPGLEAVRAEMKRKGIWAEDVSGPLKAKHNEHLVNEWNGRPVLEFSQSSHPLVPERSQSTFDRGPLLAAEKGAGSGGSPPEKIVDAAIRTDKGIFRGSTHATATVRAEDAGVNISKLNLADADGFLTSTGRYVSREEAAKIANAIGQTRKPGVQKLESSVTSYPWQSDK